MKRVLRTIEGPFCGAVYVLGRRTTIGRAADADIQIVHEGVSRHHVKLTVRGDTVELLDLDSDNGTFVGGRAVSRCELIAGDEIRVLDACFRYEELPHASDLQTSNAFGFKKTTRETLRATVQMRVAGDLRPARRAANAAFNGEHRAERRRSDRSPSVRSVPTTKSDPPGRVRPTSMVMRPPKTATARGKAGAPKPSGDDLALIQDVLEYRALRMRAVRGEPLDEHERQTYRVLEDRLQRHSVGATHLNALRRFHRFPVQAKARLLAAADALIGMPVSVEDIGAGGVKVASAIGYRSGDIVVLALDLPQRSVVIRSRVAWTDARAGHVGLAFAGAARSA